MFLVNPARIRGPALGALALAGLLGLLHLETSWVRGTASGTYDETLYRHLAHDIARTGSVRAAVDGGVAPLPVLLAWVPSARGDATVDSYAEAVRTARVRATWFFAAPLVVTVFVWCASAYGWFAGLVAGGLLALSPNVLAHASLATTDTCLMAATMATLVALTWYTRGPSVSRALLLGLGLAVATASKYSGAFLVIVVALWIWRTRPARTPTPEFRRRLALDATVFVTAFVALWGLHGWLLADLIPVRGLTPAHLERFGVSQGNAATLSRIASTPMPAVVRGIAYQVHHDRAGHVSFLFGRLSTHGWWYYFPVALLLKSTVVELAAFLIFVIAVVLKWRRSAVLATLGSAAAIFFALSLGSHLNIGVRYVLPLLPIAVVGAVLFCGDRLSHRPRLAIAAGTAALSLQAVSAAAVAPQYLSYFNPLAGGSAAGYRLLADSNVDWGQDLPSLRAWQAENGRGRVALSYFGTAPLAAYGVEWMDWRDVTSEGASSVRWLVVSATHLNGLYLCGDPFRALRSLEPDARIGYSLFAFLIDRRDVNDALARARQSECSRPD